MFDSTLLVTLLIVLAGALIGGYLNGRRKDRCLRDFEDYHVTLEKLDGRLVWGEMVLESSGIELIYRSDVQDEHHIETSYILYKDEFAQIQAIYRYCDEMDPEHWERRQQELKRAFHPGFWQRLQRRSRNFVNLASDSLSQAVGVIIGQARAPAGQYITDAGEEYLGELGRNIIGYVGTKYDPLLERYVGTKAVVEVTEGGVVYEHVGILKDYTADFLEILDVHYPDARALRVSGEQGCEQDHHLCVTREGDRLHVSNVGQNSLLLQRLKIGDDTKPLNAVLDKDDELTLHLPAGAGEVELGVKVIRHLDWILPRSHALIRHKAERYDPDQVFDIGFVLKLDRYTDEEDRLLQNLRDNPDDASCAVELGQLLFRRGELEEAERWFRHALERREALPDGGKLAERQLRYLVTKKADYKRRP